MLLLVFLFITSKIVAACRSDEESTSNDHDVSDDKSAVGNTDIGTILREDNMSVHLDKIELEDLLHDDMF